MEGDSRDADLGSLEGEEPGYGHLQGRNKGKIISGGSAETKSSGETHRAENFDDVLSDLELGLS